MWGGDACVCKGGGMCGVVMHVYGWWDVWGCDACVYKGGGMCGVVMHVCVRVVGCVGW